jgi:hypothetical protein
MTNNAAKLCEFWPYFFQVLTQAVYRAPKGTDALDFLNTLGLPGTFAQNSRGKAYQFGLTI